MQAHVTKRPHLLQPLSREIFDVVRHANHHAPAMLTSTNNASIQNLSRACGF